MSTLYIVLELNKYRKLQFFLNFRAAWFELMYQILQNSKLKEVVDQHQTQLSGLSFQNIDESDPLVAHHVWACILMIQSLYPDW